MKEREAAGPIRTLPPVLPGTAPADGQPSGQPPDRRWVPLAAIAVAIAVFAGVGIFDAPAEEAIQGATADTVPDIGGEPVTTIATEDPPLADAIPGLDANPTVVYRPDDDRTAWAEWFSRSAAPEASVSWGADTAVAAIDASGRLVMAVSDGGTGTLWVGRVPDVVPSFIDIRGAAWHPTEPARIAFVGRSPGSSRYHLFTARGVAPGGIADLVDQGPVPAGSELLAWGDWGFTLSRLVAPTLRMWEVPGEEGPGGEPARELLHITLVLDGEGDVVRSIPGVPETVGPHGELVVQPRIGAYRAAIDAGYTPDELGFQGEVVLVGERDVGLSMAAVVGPDLVPTSARFFLDETDLAEGTREFLFTPDGAVVAMVNVRDEGLEVTASRLYSNSVVRSTVDADRAVGFSRDGTYLVTQDDSTGEIVLLDWGRGSSIRIPFELGRLLVFDF